MFVSAKKRQKCSTTHCWNAASETSILCHSNKNQNARFKTVQGFEAGRSRILIANDFVSRGLDIREVTHVFNFDF
ncbi:MAG: hypothetical protein IPM04_19580 [Saprospiraceae bacterium]|nr:hypothetical protein [Candidatus Brachybacter algidus]